MNPWVALLIAVAGNVTANLAFKYAMIKSGDHLTNGNIFEFLKQPWLWIGGLACIILIASYLLAIKQIGLSTSYATVTTLALVLLTVFSAYLFGDKINIYKAIGIFLIVAGIITMMYSESL